MKSTGIVRAIDELGRLVIPKEMRIKLDVAEKGSLVDISQEGSRIIITKYYAGCHFCMGIDDISEFYGKKICKKCIEKISLLLD